MSEQSVYYRKYLSICRYYDKEIARVQSQWHRQQQKKGLTHLKSSAHIRRLYTRKKNAVHDYLHKVTCNITGYCIKNSIHTVVIGDITNIRKNNSKGHITNQKLHSLPYRQIYTMLGYKLMLTEITLVRQKESYSSQTSPLKPSVDKANACKSNRVRRGLYADGGYAWNADCVGAYNILRLYLKTKNTDTGLNPMSVKAPYVLKVAV